MFASAIIATLVILANLSFLAAKGDLEKITNKVYFDIEIGGSAAGR